MSHIQVPKYSDMSLGPYESPKYFNPVTAYLEISFIFMLPEAMPGHVCIELNAFFPAEFV